MMLLQIDHQQRKDHRQQKDVLLLLMLMGLCGVIAAVAMSLLTHAYRLAKANLVTVFEYTGMLWVPLWGYLLFAEVPAVTTVIGTAVIIAAGLFAVRASGGR